MSKRKSVLVIGMIDSIHLAKWLSRFASRELNFEIFPSYPAWSAHPKFEELQSKTVTAKYKVLEPLPRNRSIKLKMLLTKGRKTPLLRKGREAKLRQILRDPSYDYIHIHEIQKAGYLFLDSNQHFSGKPKVILSNWGSDIVLFKKYPKHLERIRELLKISDQYSAECVRDYILARELGFTGKSLPVIPTSFDLSYVAHLPNPLPNIDQRKQLIIKTYGGKIGQGLMAIKVAKKFLEAFSEAEVLLYSVTSDLYNDAMLLKQSYEPRVRVWRVQDYKSHPELMTEFSRSRIYLGLSKSDGISTAFLEAMGTGTYPIQSNTSCAGEFLIEGFQADLSELSINKVWELLQKRWVDIEKLERSVAINSKLIFEKFSPEFFQSRLDMYYE